MKTKYLVFLASIIFSIKGFTEIIYNENENMISYFDTDRNIVVSRDKASGIYTAKRFESVRVNDLYIEREVILSSPKVIFDDFKRCFESKY